MLSVDNGTLEWQWQCNGHIFAPLVQAKGEILVCCHSANKTGTLVVLDRENKKEKFVYSLASAVTGSPFVQEGENLAILFDISGCCHLLSFNDENVGCHYQVKQQLTRIEGDVFSSPVVLENLLFIGCRDNYFYCFEILDN